MDSFSIDRKRKRGEFGKASFLLLKNGKKVGQLIQLTQASDRLVTLSEMIKQSPKTVALILPLSEDYSELAKL